jgi:Rps23 Pro-64 3,4-dihydroxylase Tpa1-like proline 4-hydroxylase
MKLREFFYFDRDTVEPIEDKSYDPSMDDSVLNKDDTRKTRLTLRQINKARKAAELHQEESKKDLVYIRQMYGLAANAEGV